MYFNKTEIKRLEKMTGLKGASNEILAYTAAKMIAKNKLELQ